MYSLVLLYFYKIYFYNGCLLVLPPFFSSSLRRTMSLILSVLLAVVVAFEALENCLVLFVVYID